MVLTLERHHKRRNLNRAISMSHGDRAGRRGRPCLQGLHPRPLFRRGKTKEVHAVDDVSFTVGRNEIFGILGANGSGKSTLIRMLSTLLIPDSGRVEVFGYDVRRDEAEVKRLINRVSVEASFFKKLSPGENLAYAAAPVWAERTGGARRDLRRAGATGIARDKVSEPLEQLSRECSRKWPSPAPC